MTSNEQTLVTQQPWWDQQNLKIGLQDVEHQCPCRVDKQDEQPNSVGDAVGFREWVAEPAGGSDVLLQQVTCDDEADQYPDPAPLYGAREQARSHHYQENQSAGHLQPICQNGNDINFLVLH